MEWLRNIALAIGFIVLVVWLFGSGDKRASDGELCVRGESETG